MGRGIRVARLFGIDIAIHPSWFIILVLLVWSLGANVFPNAYDWSQATYWTVAVVAALLLFASVLAHELAHSLIARRQGIPVRSITLFLLGGVASIEREPATPGQEAIMASAGPLTSLIIGGGTLAIGWAFQEPQTVSAILIYLGGVNILLGLFNLLPGFPLDGGRVLRAIIWRRTGSFDRATRAAARTGTALGYLLILAGVLLAITVALVSGLWIGFIGWVLVQASQTTLAFTIAEQRLLHVPVTRVMTAPRGWIPSVVTLEAAAHDYFLGLDARCLPVGHPDAEFEGIVCLTDLQQSERSRWGHDRVHEVMVPREKLAQVGPHASAADALRLMNERDVNQVAVIDEERLLGLVDRARVLQFVQILSPTRQDGGARSLN